MNAYDRHKSLINSYQVNIGICLKLVLDFYCVLLGFLFDLFEPPLQLYYPGATASLQRDIRGDRRDIDVIKEHHRFAKLLLKQTPD